MADARAEVVLPSPNFDETLAYFREKLGFQLDAIFPADDPATASLSGYGLHLRLDRDAEEAPSRIVIEHPGDPGFLDSASKLTAPNGTVIEINEAGPDYLMPPLQQALAIQKMAPDGSGDEAWGVGRAGMLYRDLIPGREGGRFIASHIRIPNGGPVPDNVHFHKIRFQMIYVYKGWVRLVYEDQGEPFVMEAGDCVLQPPQIRHRVMESSDGLEVIEIGSPANHMTLLDHTLDLPTGKTLPDRDYGGQRYVLHKAAAAAWRSADWDGFEARDLGIRAATDDLARVDVLRQTAPDAAVAIENDGEFLFHFVLEGAGTLEIKGSTLPLAAGDCFTLPTDLMATVKDCRDLSVLRVAVPGE